MTDIRAEVDARLAERLAERDAQRRQLAAWRAEMAERRRKGLALRHTRR